MSDRDYKKHLKKTGNLKDLKKEPYSYKHQSDEKYKDAVKSYDDGINKSVKDSLDKKQAQKDKLVKDRMKEKENRGYVGGTVKNFGKTIKKVPKLVTKDHYDWKAELTEMDLKKTYKLKKGSKEQQDLDPTSSQKKDKLDQHNLGLKLDKAHYEPSNWRDELSEKCWPGYEKKGMKTMFGKRYPNCVKKSKKKK